MQVRLFGEFGGPAQQWMWLLGGVVFGFVKRVVEFPPIIFRKVVRIQARLLKSFHKRDMREKERPKPKLTDEGGYTHDETHGYSRNERFSDCTR